MRTAAAARRRNTFSKFAGSTYACQVCGRQTRLTREQVTSIDAVATAFGKGGR